MLINRNPLRSTEANLLHKQKNMPANLPRTGAMSPKHPSKESPDRSRGHNNFEIALAHTSLIGVLNESNDLTELAPVIMCQFLEEGLEIGRYCQRHEFTGWAQRPRKGVFLAAVGVGLGQSPEDVQVF
jgi:hypothetical protein